MANKEGIHHLPNGSIYVEPDESKGRASHERVNEALYTLEINYQSKRMHESHNLHLTHSKPLKYK